MKRTTIGSLFVLAILLVGCTQLIGSGNVVMLEETVSGFDRVDADQGFDVEISQGEAFNVIVRVDDNIADHVSVAKQGSTLKIGLRPGRVYNLSNATLEAEITMPELTGIDLSGGSHASVTGFKSTERLAVDLSGGSQMRGDIEAGNMNCDLSGGSDITLDGSAQDLTIDVSGGSQVMLRDFAVIDAYVNASGGSQTTLNPSGRLDVDASGGSRVYYVGSPTMGNIDTSGSSSVESR